ncbi:SprT-like domain-containing protein [Prevotella scopos JCM 17725]|uniref:SprT-like family protein n=1 Tax=Prevotella scopos JCM 17725 TaxID=1236518 RepID=A0AAX2F5J8_9BACT|nr:SprT-like domain-containing protein [Prevotella scopos]ANR72627.1 transcription elongation protein SprT [Prevotella scopos JCM 17725]QUB45158.1 SprT-like domain-containing protein [Prevotella scopos JCM 17725]SHF98216.1 SprT-like family protein [Prevotella scopos JCM 17725]
MNAELTIDYLRQAFEHYNDLIFEGKLPVPKLKWSRAKTRLGQMACKRKTSWGRIKYYDFTISISNYYKLTKEEIDDVLIHEMIHYSIAYTGLKDTSAHGIVFRGMMDKINRTFNRHITISVRTRNLQARSVQQPKDYLILALKMKDGKYFLSSVNPSAAGKLAISLARAREIAHYAWYQSQDEYFRSMPRVRSLRGRQVSAEVYETMIEKMKLLK